MRPELSSIAAATGLTSARLFDLLDRRLDLLGREDELERRADLAVGADDEEVRLRRELECVRRLDRRQVLTGQDGLELAIGELELVWLDVDEGQLRMGGGDRLETIEGRTARRGLAELRSREDEDERLPRGKRS